ncbi:DUF4440 domain-containing protein [Glycomyces arizonensis]|uniref:DUF4440 domain-containing protein n=1 Tax=Glycomyces arizonensis TaxID=256035 RepID=UPI000404D6C3|nr:DUF4440 domain-containing protein [Glycomyces arizonensis]
MDTINRADLAEAIESGTVVVVDALPARPYENRHLPGARNLTIEELADADRVLPDKDARIVTYSTDAACTRGPELAEALTAAGYTGVSNYAEGIAGWADAGMPLESGAASAASGDEAAVQGAVRRWAEMERAQDADGLEELLTESFTGIGPVGFVLDGPQWAGRHRDGGLVNHELDIADVDVVTEGDVAIAHVVETQRATARGHESNGSFRVGLVLVRRDTGWKIARIQFSGPMIQPGQAPPQPR